MTAPLTPYDYTATIESVTDGDTVVALIDLGFSILHRVNVRLWGCNAAEHATPAGDAATANLRALLPVGTRVGLRSKGADKYGGRTDAALLLKDKTGALSLDLATTLIATGWAAKWDGTGVKPLPAWPIPVPVKVG